MEILHKGTILLVNPRTRSALIQDEDDPKKIVEAPIYSSSTFIDGDTNSYSIDILPKEGTKVILKYVNRVPIIAYPGIEPKLSTDEDKKVRRKVTNVNMGADEDNGMVVENLPSGDGYEKTGGTYFGSEDSTLGKVTASAKKDYSVNCFEDLMAGDKVISTKDGNLIGVLEGGVNLFKASDLCQIIGMRYKDLLRFVSRNFEHFTDFGTIEVKNEEGITSMRIKGSSTYKASRKGEYHLSLYLGGGLDGIYKLEVFKGRTSVYVMHINAEGSVSVVSSGDIYKINGNRRLTIDGEDDVHIEKKSSYVYKNDYFHHIYGTSTILTDGNKTENIKKFHTFFVGKDQTLNVGGVRNEILKGIQTPQDAIALQAGLGFVEKDTIFQTLNFGNKKELIENKGSFIRETKDGGFEYKATGGDYKLDILEKTGLTGSSGGNYSVNVNDNVLKEIGRKRAKV